MMLATQTTVRDNPVPHRAEYDTREKDICAKCIDASRRVSWDIEGDVIRGRSFDLRHKFLPDGLSRISDLAFLSAQEKRYLSQIQGRTYARTFALVERFIDTMVREIRDQRKDVVGAAFGRFSEEENKHQLLFKRIDEEAERVMPSGYHYPADADGVASVVLGKSKWAVLGLTLHIELFTQSHYKESIEADDSLSPLFRDVFFHHWQEERQHAILDEMEWRKAHDAMTPEERDQGVDDLIELVGAVDGILQAQAEEDARYFTETSYRNYSRTMRRHITDGLVKAYRWQYILSGVQHPHFIKVLGELTTDEQRNRIQAALTGIC